WVGSWNDKPGACVLGLTHHLLLVDALRESSAVIVRVIPGAASATPRFHQDCGDFTNMNQGFNPCQKRLRHPSRGGACSFRRSEHPSAGWARLHGGLGVQRMVLLARLEASLSAPAAV